MYRICITEVAQIVKVPDGVSRPVSLILGLEPALDLASIVLRRFRRPAYSSHLAPLGTFTDATATLNRLITLDRKGGDRLFGDSRQ